MSVRRTASTIPNCNISLYSNETSILLHFELYQNLQPTKFPFKICISNLLRNTYFKYICKILMGVLSNYHIYCVWLQPRQSRRLLDFLTDLEQLSQHGAVIKTMIII